MSPVRKQIKDIQDSYAFQNYSSQQPRPDLKTMQDKNAYMTFLEIQLERVSQTCLNSQNIAGKVDTLCAKVSSHEEKIVNISRLLKLLQSYSDAQEEDSDKLRN